MKKLIPKLKFSKAIEEPERIFITGFIEKYIEEQELNKPVSYTKKNKLNITLKLGDLGPSYLFHIINKRIYMFIMLKGTKYLTVEITEIFTLDDLPEGVNIDNFPYKLVRALKGEL